MTNNQLTAEQLVMLQLRIMSALSFYQQRPEKEAKKMAELLTLAGAAASELQERQKAAAEPIAWTEKCEITNMQATGLYLRGFPDNSLGRDIALYSEPPAPVVPADCPSEIRDLIAAHSDALFINDDAQEIWNACRAVMLQNSTAVPEQSGTTHAQEPVQSGDHVDGESGRSIKPAPILDSSRENAEEDGELTEDVKYPLPPELSIVWYSTPEEAYGKMWEPAAAEEGMTVDELVASSTFTGCDQHGADVEVSSEDAFDGMRALGCWGWVNTEMNVIHAWSSPDVDPAMVMHFLAHEIAHATGVADDDDFQEEMRAEQYGHVARLAFKLFSEHTSSPPAPALMKDHQIRELVNSLLDIAVEYHGTQQLREHIARVVRAAVLEGE